MTSTDQNTTLSSPAAPAAGHTASMLAESLACLREGGVVATPTDTLYGLAADVRNETALQRVFDIKGRPANLALPVLVANWEQVGMVAQVPEGPVGQLASAFWPGSLTLVLPKRPGLSPLVTGGRETVAVRMPDHWVPLNLAGALGAPVTGTSANRSGQPDLNSPAEIREHLGDSVGAVVDAGPAPGGVQSTIVDFTGERPALLREGATPFADVERVWQELMAGAPAPDFEGV